MVWSYPLSKHQDVTFCPGKKLNKISKINMLKDNKEQGNRMKVLVDNLVSEITQISS